MDTIRISNSGSGQSVLVDKNKNLIKNEKVEKDSGKARPATVSKKSGMDKVVISRQAREAAKIHRYTMLAKQLPDSDEQKVELAKENLSKGAYWGREIADKIAEKLLNVI